MHVSERSPAKGNIHKRWLQEKVHCKNSLTVNSKGKSHLTWLFPLQCCRKSSGTTTPLGPKHQDRQQMLTATRTEISADFAIKYSFLKHVNIIPTYTQHLFHGKLLPVNYQNKRTTGKVFYYNHYLETRCLKYLCMHRLSKCSGLADASILSCG